MSTELKTKRSIMFASFAKKYLQLHYVLLFFLLVIITLLKIYFVQQTTLPDYNSFYGIRQIDHIHQTGMPFLKDSLSYQGRVTFEGLFFYTFLSLFSFLVPTLFLFKYASILFSLLSLLLIYIISLRLVKKPLIALLVVFVASLTPHLFTTHLNSLLPSSLFVVLYLLLIHLFFQTTKQRAISWFIALLVFSTLISSLTLIFVLGLALYFLFLKLESLPIKRREFELLLFSGVFIIWYHLLVYKPLFLQYGAEIIWKTMPKELVVSTFQGLTLPLAISFIGVIPLLLGIHTIYYSLFVKRNRKHLFLIALTFLFSLATWFGFLALNEGLFYTTITLVLLSGPAIMRLQIYIEKTIFPKAKYVFLVLLLVVTLLNFSSVFIYPSTILSNAPSEDKAAFFTQLQQELPVDATVLAHISEGHLITALSQRKNFYDENFILAPNAPQRYVDAKLIFLSQSQPTMLATLQHYGVTHIVVSPLLGVEYPKLSQKLLTGSCFLPVLSNDEITVYEILCQLKN